MPIKRRIDKGIALLDLRGPENWQYKIDPEIIDITKPSDCILGQIYDGGYCYATETLGLVGDEVTEHGFCNESFDPDEINALNAEWRLRLAKVWV